MSKKSNPALIGSFVLGAITLFVAAALLFGGSEMFKEKSRFVSYFSGSVQGLRVGSNVLFRGVRVGYVTDIKLIASLDNLDTLIPVVYEIDAEQFSFIQGNEEVVRAKAVNKISIDEWINAGLRAQLDSESFVTGQLMIELDFLPDTKAVFANKTVPYPEIPTVTSGITQAIEDAQRFFAELQQGIDVKELGNKFNSILDGVDQLANSQELRRAFTGIDTLVNSQGAQALPEDISNAVKDLTVAINSAQVLIDNLDKDVGPAINNLAGTLEQAEALLYAARNQLDGESVLSVQLAETLTEVSDAARSIRVLADYLEQHPEALVRGKK